MPVVNELIRKETDNTISFGDYTLEQKSKKEDFEHNGDLYKVKTFKGITRLERNGMFVYESVPGTTVERLSVSDNGMEFYAEGSSDVQITVELEAGTEYNASIDDESVGMITTNLSGKLVMGIDLSQGRHACVKIVKV